MNSESCGAVQCPDLIHLTNLIGRHQAGHFDSLMKSIRIRMFAELKPESGPPGILSPGLSVHSSHVTSLIFCCGIARRDTHFVIVSAVDSTRL